VEESVLKGYTTIAPFSERIGQLLQRDMTESEKYDGGALVYVGGFVQDAHGSHPEIYAVRNMALDPTTGDYINAGYMFECDEQFWGRDYALYHLAPGLTSGDHFLYAN